jgi:hypothetical protein
MIRLVTLFIMTPRTNHQALIYQVVRGERPCTDLGQLGIKLEYVDGDWHIESPSLDEIKLHISDIAHGLVKYQSSPSDLKKWARLILSGSGFIDLSECESQTGWEVLLNALWDSMSTGEFSTNAKHLAQELAGQ